MDWISEQNVAGFLAGLSAFAAIAALALPVKVDGRLQARLRRIARERERLRERRLGELAAGTKRRVRKAETGFLAKWNPNGGKAGSRAEGDIAARLRMAGFRGQTAEAVFLFCRLACPLLACAATLAALQLRTSALTGALAWLIACFAAGAAGYVLPRLVLDRLVARRQKLILRAFPDALDLLLICVQSGMSVEAALGRVTKDIAHQCIELAEEFSLTMAELSYLPVRWRAYGNLGDRIGLPAVKLITSALIQAERHGTSIGQALTAAATQAREGRISEAERKAAALGPKLSIPLVVFFLPVLLTIILAPALMRAGDALKQNNTIIIGRDR
jgi:tight adherence protein C